MRPTGLVDPILEVRPAQTQVDDLLSEIKLRTDKRERVLVEHTSKRSPDEMLARTDGYRAVVVPAGRQVVPGALLDVTITRATPATLFGTHG